MKIAVYYNLPAGGAKRYIFEEAKILCRGHFIDVYTLSASDIAFCDLAPFTKNTFVYNFKKIKLLKFPFSRLNWIIQIADIYKMQQVLKKMAADIDKNNYDVILVNTCIYTEIPLFIKQLKTPVVYFAHSIQFKTGKKTEMNDLKLYRKIIRRMFPDFGQRIYNSILDKKKTENIKNANMTLTVSKFLKEQLTYYYKISAKVNYPGVDLKRFTQNTAFKKENMVVSAGNLRPNKGYDFIIKSVSLIEKELRPCVGIAYNEGAESEKNYLIKLADLEGVEIKLFKDQDIVEIYNKARIVVVSSYYEGLGLVALEAMACGVPVIGVNEGGIRETILHEKTGFLLDRNPEKFAEAIKYLLVNENAAKKYGEQGRKYVIENWTWEKSAGEMEKHFYDVIRNK